MPWTDRAARVSPGMREREERRPRLRHVWQRIVVVGNQVAGLVNTLSALVLTASRLESRVVRMADQLESMHAQHVDLVARVEALTSILGASLTSAGDAGGTLGAIPAQHQPDQGAPGA